ncbi:hypothetical protein Leryth_006984 [Lithospermum erythrorhizon]|nr:hypothetical protein Leryth_006984 [Lithospermum erythrorhizon]
MIASLSASLIFPQKNLDEEYMGQCASTQSWQSRKACNKHGKTRNNHGFLGMVKEQRSRFYIARKCIVMLLESLISIIS